MSAGSSPGRWALMVGMLAASGWASATLWERSGPHGGQSPPAKAEAEGAHDGLAAAYQHLAADELDEAREALGALGESAEAQEGKVWVAVRAAEKLELEHRHRRACGPPCLEKANQLLDALDHAVHDAREIIAEARRRCSDPIVSQRVALAERRLNSMLVFAFIAAGDADRARGVLSARLATHPQKEVLAKMIAPSAPSASASSKAPPEAAPPIPRVRPTPAQAYEPHYELDHEPTMDGHPRTPGELELPTAPN